MQSYNNLLRKLVKELVLQFIAVRGRSDTAAAVMVVKERFFFTTIASVRSWQVELF